MWKRVEAPCPCPVVGPSTRPRRAAVSGRLRPLPVRRCWCRSPGRRCTRRRVRPRAWPWRAGASVASARRKFESAPGERPGHRLLAGVAGGAMAVLDTPSSRKRRIAFSLPSSRETPSEPFGRPSFRPEALVPGRSHGWPPRRTSRSTPTCCGMSARSSGRTSSSTARSRSTPPSSRGDALSV